MTNFEKFKSMSREELIDWLNKYGDWDNAPWLRWFDTQYCSKCAGIIKKLRSGDKMKFNYCELNEHCRAFPEEDIGVNFEINKWLDAKVEEE